MANPETKLTIANTALLKLGQSPIASLTDEYSSNARAMNRFINNARRGVLELANWSFATKRVKLAQDAVAPAFGFDHQYTLPADFLRPQVVYSAVNPEVELDAKSGGYKIENGKLLTDADNVYLIYTYNREDISGMSTSFTDLWSEKLVADAAYTVTKSLSEATSRLQFFQLMVPQASSTDHIGDPEDLVIDTSPLTSNLGV